MRGWFVVPLATAIAALVGGLTLPACGSEASPVVIVGAEAGPDDGGVDAGVTCTPEMTDCRVGACVVTGVAGGALGTTVQLAEATAPADLAGDVLAPNMCDVRVADGASVTLTLAIALTAPAPAGAALFRYTAPYAHAVEGSLPIASTVVGVVTQSGLFGTTTKPAAWSVEATVSDDPLSSDDFASLVRNVTSQTISAAYYDGQHLVVGSGPRVLVFDGLPTSPKTKPKLVLGQPSLDVILPGTSASTFSAVSAIWSNGQKLVVVDGNRALVWNSFPTASFVPADLVVGQQDFVARDANIGGVSASTLRSPQGVDSDGTRLLVADSLNNRLLVWSAFPTSIGQPATSVIGQPSFTSVTPTPFQQPWGGTLADAGAYVASAFSGVFHVPNLATNVAPDFTPVPEVGPPARVRSNAIVGATNVTVTSNGGLAILDNWGSRIAIQRTATQGAANIDFALGQPDASRRVKSLTSASTISERARAISANGLLLVPDGNRLLVYTSPPAYAFEPAARVFGQAGFSINDAATDYRRISASSLAYPSDVAQKNGLVAVADRGNNRVVLYPSSATSAPGAAATVVLGQPDAVSFTPNLDPAPASATTLSGPAGVALDGSRLIVADTENHRVLVWSPVPTVSNTPATYVLGQADFTGHRPNRGRGDANNDGYSDATADGMFSPTGVASDGTNLYVADRLNNRVLVYANLAALSSGKSADAVLGQADFSSVLPNRGDASTPRIDGLNLPTGVTVDGANLWVADTENNRLVRYDAVATAPTPSMVVGQTDGATISNPNTAIGGPNAGFPTTQVTSSASVLRPRGVAVSGGSLFVSETDSNRVHLFTHTVNGAESYVHAAVLGQASDATGAANGSGLGAGSLSSPLGLAADGSRLLVSDSANHRVLGFDLPTSAAASATVVIGQSTFATNGFDQAAPTSAGGAARPRGTWLSQGDLFVAETSLNRLVVHELPLVAGKTPKRILGQADASGSLPNGGGAASASTLSSPRGVYADATRVVVADTGNNRVLVYPRTGDLVAATLVLGQADFTSTAPNRGAAAARTSLRSPEGVFSDGQRLYVADTGNHRVLVWNTFPTANGQPADVVIGQADATGSSPNGATGTASASSLSAPSSAILAGNALFIADTGNNRIVRYDATPSSDGATASGVWGQPDTSSRTPASDTNDATRLSGPVALATDGSNLYVAERDTSRVAVFALGSTTPTPTLMNSYAGLSLAGPAGIAVERTPLFTSRLYVADTNNDRIVVVGSVSRLASP